MRPNRPDRSGRTSAIQDADCTLPVEASEAALATGPWDAELRERQRRRENDVPVFFLGCLNSQDRLQTDQIFYRGMDALT